MPSLAIAEFSREDIPFGKQLTDIEGWHRTREDWSRLLDLEPHGVFKAVMDGTEAGVAAVITYDRVCWVHSVIVRRDNQRTGIGSALVRRCLEFAHSRGATTVKLDSVGGCEPFYERLGFVREFRSLRCFGKGVAFDSEATKARGSDLSAICVFDKMVTGLDRQRVVTALFRDAPELAYVLRKQGKLRGYVLGRRGDDRIQIGPCIVYPDRTSYARELLSAMITDNEKWNFRACVPALNPKAKGLVEKLGLEVVDLATRMYQGIRLQEAASVYVMMSPEKG